MIDIDDFVGVISDPRLLPPKQSEIVFNDMLPICSEVSVLARELIYRGWLNRFQMERILTGRGDSLFIGPYVLLDVLGEGGMGKVYRALNPRVNKIVAIKVLRDDKHLDNAIVARFLREICAIGQLDHPNIVSAFDAGGIGEQLYYAMEYVPGIDLGRHVMYHGPLAVGDACYYMLQAAHALDYANQRNLVHRDIKPTNLLLVEGTSLIKLLDLGLTRTEVPVEDSIFAEITKVGLLVGTPDFMSPEQIEDSRNVDIRSDIYSLGCTLYYLLAGVAPFGHVRSQVEKLEHHYEHQPVPIEEHRTILPPEVAELVRRMMAKKARDRFPSPAQLIKALDRICAAFPRTRKAEHDLQAHLSPSRSSIGNLHDPSHNSLPSTEVIRGALAYRFVPSSCLSAIQAPIPVEEPKKVERTKPNPVRLISAVLIGTLGMLLTWSTQQRRSTENDLPHPPKNEQEQDKDEKETPEPPQAELNDDVTSSS